MVRRERRGSQQREERYRLIRLEDQFLPFLILVLLPVFVMPFANPKGSSIEPFLLPLLINLLVIQSIRMLPVIRSSSTAGFRVWAFRALGILSALGIWIPALLQGWPQPFIRITVLLFLTLFFLITSVRLVRLLASVPRVNLKVLAGAAGGYIHLGMTGGILATTIQVIHPGSFNLGHQAPSEFLLDRLTYFSFVTIAGLGYGDVVPTNPIGERIVILLSLSGTLYVSLLVGLLMGRFIANQEVDLLQQGGGEPSSREW